MLTGPPPEVSAQPSVTAPSDRDDARPAHLRTVLAAGCGVLLLAGCTAGAASPVPLLAPLTPTSSATAASASASANKAIPAPSAGGWQLNGSARIFAGTLGLTTARVSSAGSAIWPHPLRGITSLNASFDVQMGGGTGADGVTFALIDARMGRSTSLGDVGGGLGWAGIPGKAIALDTFQNPGDPSYNGVGLVTGFIPHRPDRLTWADSAAAIPPLRNGIRHVSVTVDHELLTVTVDRAVAFTALLALPKKLLVGFTAATGARTDRHVVSHVAITAG
jgi:lectin family protein